MKPPRLGFVVALTVALLGPGIVQLLERPSGDGSRSLPSGGPEHIQELATDCAAPGRKAPHNCEHRLRMPQCLAAADLQVKLARGADPRRVARDHGIPIRDFDQVDLGPYDDIDRSVGMDRHYSVRVDEKGIVTKIRELGQDPRIEYADFDSGTQGYSRTHADAIGVTFDEPCFGW